VVLLINLKLFEMTAKKLRLPVKACRHYQTIRAGIIQLPYFVSNIVVDEKL
jgi:hypothetical protein